MAVRQNLLTGSSTAKFKSVELHGQLQRITDSRGPRLIVHEFPYRDGAKIEVMGGKPHRTEWELTYTGSNWISDFLTLARSIEEDPSGLLVHPIYGQMPVVCQGFDRAVTDIVNAVDTITFALVFVEDQQDLGTTQQSAATRKQTVNVAGEDLLTKAEAYVSAGVAVQSLVDASASYAQAAFEAAANAAVDTSLPAMLDIVGEQASAVQTAILADPLGGDALTYDALAQAEVVYASCLDLADEVALEAGAFELFTTVGLTSIGVICGNKYGSLAISKIDLVLQLNPQLINPSAIPAGITIILPI